MDCCQFGGDAYLKTRRKYFFKSLLIEDILKAMGVQPNEKQKGIWIRHVTYDRWDIESNTVYFRAPNERFLMIQSEIERIYLL